MDRTFKLWLFQQCRMIPGLVRAVLLTGPPEHGPFDRAVHWPDERHDFAVLTSTAQKILHSKQIVIKTRNNEMPDTGEPLDAVASPLILKGRLYGAVALEITHRPQELQRTVVQQIQTGIKWLETITLMMDSTANSQMINLIDLIATGLDHESFHTAAIRVANELETRFNCTSASIGFLHNKKVRVEVVSNSSKIDSRSNRIREIQEAMNESLDQGAIITYPPIKNSSPLITQFNQRLAKSHGEFSVCTLPLVKNQKAVGAMTLKRKLNTPFTPEIIKQLEQIALLLGPVMKTRKNEEQPLLEIIIKAIKKGLHKLFGPRHPMLKTGVAAALFLLFWVSVVNGTFLVSGNSTLEAEICRTVVAPQQGYVSSANVRPGDLVQKGEQLASMDDRDLLLEQRKWQSEKSKLLKEYRMALTSFDRAEIAIIKAKRTQAEAQLQLVEQQLDRIKLVAPFSGLVVRGDLTQAIGSPVERGEVLYEIAPTDSFRVIVKVNEHDIGFLTKGQQGRLKLESLPDRSIGITIKRITPVSTTDQGQNFFKVEAVMDSHSDLFRPGMQGVAKIRVGEKKLIWIWSRPLVNRLRLLFWNWLP